MKISWTDDSVIHTYVLEPDSTVTETHVATAMPTQHPVEKGVAITDHVQPQPSKISCDCVISNTPIYMPNDDFTDGLLLDTGAPLPVKDLQGNVLMTAATQQIAGDFDRVRWVHTALEDARAAGTLIKIETALATYENMVIVGLSIPRSSQHGSSSGRHHSMRFSMDCQQIRLVQTSEVAPPAPLHVKKQKANKPAKEMDTKKPDNKTLALRMVNAAGLLQ